MGSFEHFIEVTPEWEKIFSPQHTAMLLCVSKATAAAVGKIVPGKLPHAWFIAPSEVPTNTELRWNRFWSTVHADYTFERWVYFTDEEDAEQYQNVCRNITAALDYMPNTRVMDMSRGPFMRPVVQWSLEDSNAFAPLLAQKCVGLQELRLGAAMLHMVCRDSNDAAYWTWLHDLTHLHTLCLEGIGLSSTTGGDVLKVAMKSTSLTSLSMDHNPIGDLGAILEVEAEGDFRLQDLSLGYCDFGWLVLTEDFTLRSVDAVTHLMTQYTSLTKLNLRGNQYSDPHGKAIAKALRTVTNLTQLDLLEHNISFEVQDEIRAAWNAYPPRQDSGIIIDHIDLPNFQWDMVFPAPFPAEGPAAHIEDAD